MSEDKIILEALNGAIEPFKEIESFSEKPGIYGVYFMGSHFPIKEIYNILREPKLLYIGKTEESQLKRDAQTHFYSDKTGNSTLRRSIGALLRENLSLVPVPRSEKNVIKGRHSFF